MPRGIEVESTKGEEEASRWVWGEDPSLEEAVRVVSVAGEASSDCVTDVGIGACSLDVCVSRFRLCDEEEVDGMFHCCCNRKSEADNTGFVSS